MEDGRGKSYSKGYMTHKNLCSVCANSPQRFSSGTNGGRKPSVPGVTSLLKLTWLKTIKMEVGRYVLHL